MRSPLGAGSRRRRWRWRFGASVSARSTSSLSSAPCSRSISSPPAWACPPGRPRHTRRARASWRAGRTRRAGGATARCATPGCGATRTRVPRGARASRRCGPGSRLSWINFAPSPAAAPPPARAWRAVRVRAAAPVPEPGPERAARARPGPHAVRHGRADGGGRGVPAVGQHRARPGTGPITARVQPALAPRDTRSFQQAPPRRESGHLKRAYSP